MIEILAVTTWNKACGISEYAHHLSRTLPGDMIIHADEAWLDPGVFFQQFPTLLQYQGPQVVWLNYHAALHSRWTTRDIAQLQSRLPVVITYHDTGVPNSKQCRDLYLTLQDYGWVQSAFIIHEPCEDLPSAHYIRQGIPDWQPPVLFSTGRRVAPPDVGEDVCTDSSLPGNIVGHGAFAGNNRPVLGTVGFPFPWKNYDLLAEATARAGWSLLLLAPGATPADVTRWRSLNPWTGVDTRFIPAETVVRYLAGCDATAFIYSCANTGTSGAIRQGIAARKPVLALSGCRQFRDLELDPLGNRAIIWVTDASPEGLAQYLELVWLARIDAGIQRLAERDSWRNVAEHYATIIRDVVNHVTPTAQTGPAGPESTAGARS